MRKERTHCRKNDSNKRDTSKDLCYNYKIPEHFIAKYQKLPSNNNKKNDKKYKKKDKAYVAE